MSRSLSLLPLIGCLLGIAAMCEDSANAEQALPKEEIARPLVVDLTTLTKVPRTEAIQALIAERTPLLPGTYPLISGASTEFVELFRWVYPSEPVAKCPATLEPTEGALERARSLIVELELEDAVQILETTYDTLPCYSEPISQESLHRLFYLEAIAFYYEGSTESSNRAFLAALAINPTAEPLPGFPPDLADAYRASAQMLPMLPPVKIDIDPGLRQAGLKIDGVALPDADATVNIRPGRHVAQVFNPGGLARTQTFTIDPGDTRSMSDMINIMPPGSSSYLNALFRTALQNQALDRAQRLALDTYARLNNHPALLFVLISSSAPGGQLLLSHVPGKGLIEGPPPGMLPLPPMVEDAPVDAQPPKISRRQLRKEQKERVAKAQKERSQADDSGISYEQSPTRRPTTDTRQTPTERPKSQKPDRSAPSNRVVVRLELGSLSYEQAVFANLLPSASLRLWQGLHFYAGLHYANDFGLQTDGMLNMLGLQLGMEYEVPLETLSARAGLGLGFSTARVYLADDGAQKLLLQGTPEGWLGLDYHVSDALRVGAVFGGGYSPGVGEAGSTHGLWRAGLTFGFSL